MTSRIPQFILMIGLFLVLSTSCRYKIEKYDDKITGLWYYRDETCQRYNFFALPCADDWLFFSEDGTFGSMAGPDNLDSMRSGPFAYELDGNILTRYYPNWDRQDSIEIKWRLGGKKLIFSYIGGSTVETYTFLRKNP